ncbi:MAG: hypothetical protein ACKO9Q_27075, partial [Pirellula sp.]
MLKIFKGTRILSAVLSIAAASFPMLCLAQDPPEKQQNGNPDRSSDRKPNGGGRGQQGGQQGGQRGGPKGGGGSGLGGYEKPPSPANDVPTRPFDLVLGRPTDVSITLRVMPFENGQGRVCYGVEENNPNASGISTRQTTAWT